MYVDPDPVKTLKSIFFQSGNRVNVYYQQELYIHEVQIPCKIPSKAYIKLSGLKTKNPLSVTICEKSKLFEPCAKERTPNFARRRKTW